MALVKTLFERSKHPIRGLLAVEWAMLVYLLITLFALLFFSSASHLPSFSSAVNGRLLILVATAVLWAIYRLLPCRLTHMIRVTVQLSLLSWWYPDTYDLNSAFSNLDHVFAQMEQSLLGCHPALIVGAKWSYPVVSELMNLGYASYFPMILVITLYYFVRHYELFGFVSFVIIASFFSYYVVYDLLPVTGPQYYYLAVGTDNIANGVFPSVGSYFATHTEALPIPGWSDGFFYQLVVDAHSAGERPTAAFPSSHVGISTIIMFLAWKTRSRKLFFPLLFLYVLLCLSTVYIQAHYVVDVLGGWLSAILLLIVFYYPFRNVIKEG